MNRHRIIALGVSTLLLVALTPSFALAAGPITAPEGFAELRARFEDLTAEEVQAAGYAADTECVAVPGLGGMGIHALDFELLGMQFPAGTMDPENPPVLLLSADGHRVVGLEWEAKDIGQGEFELYGQAVVLQDGHPGVPEPHYMLHAYFRPNGEVLFAPFDPQLSCLPDTDTVGVPGSSVGAPLLVFALLAMAGVAGASMALRQRSRREPASPA
jgi:hypothetical protein